MLSRTYVPALGESRRKQRSTYGDGRFEFPANYENDENGDGQNQRIAGYRFHEVGGGQNAVSRAAQESVLLGFLLLQVAC